MECLFFFVPRPTIHPLLFPGLSFLIPCELRLPHSGPVDPDGQWNFSLKAGEGGGKWNQMDLDVGKAAADGNFLSVPISRF